jgi:hypothetical protein
VQCWLRYSSDTLPLSRNTIMAFEIVSEFNGQDVVGDDGGQSAAVTA